MEEIGIVQRVRRGRYFFFLKDTYDEESIETMILEAMKELKVELGVVVRHPRGASTIR